MAANTSSGNQQAYEAPGIRIFQGLDPDVVLIQEFNYESGSLRDLVDLAFGSDFDYYVEGGNEQIPNGIISRYPIVAAGEWNDAEVSNRDFAWARIDIPGDIDLWAVSVHLLTSGSGVRNTEATALVNFIQANVPQGVYLVVGGDFNTDNFGESALSTLSAVVETDGRPDDQDGRTGTNASRAKPYDQVLPDAALEALEIPVSIAGHGSTYAEGLVFDSRVFTPLSAVSPVRLGDSGASSMQHMAVIRDFLLPTGTGSSEPVDYPSDFAGSVTDTAVTLTWTDVSSTPVPAGYVVKALASGSIAAPVDGSLPTLDNDLSDGSAEVVIAPGVGTVSFSGLPSETNYTFQIYPYSDVGSINFKTNGTVPSLSLTTSVAPGDGLAAPTLGLVYYRHSQGFTVTWDKVVDATGYRLDVSKNANFSGVGGGTLLSENFDVSTNLPSGWVNSGTQNWNNSAHYASAPNCRAFGPNDTLETPAVDFPSELKFNVDASGGGDGQTGTVSYSISGGSWLPLDSFVVSLAGTVETIDLTANPDLSDQADVRFRFESTFFTWYLDDVLVSAVAAPSFVAGYEDLAVGDTRFHAVEGLEADSTYYFRVRAENASGTSLNSATGSVSTTFSGTPFSFWADSEGIGLATLMSDFDQDQQSDFKEYAFATDPKSPTVKADLLEAAPLEDGLRITHRKSKAPNLEWSYFGSALLSDLGSPLEEGTAVGEYEVLSTADRGTYEEVTLDVNVGSTTSYFFKIAVVEKP